MIYLRNAPWHILDSVWNLDDKVDLFNRIFLQIVDKHTLLIEKRVKHLRQPPWFNDEIHRNISQRDWLLDKATKSNDSHWWNLFKTQKTKLQQWLGRQNKISISVLLRIILLTVKCCGIMSGQLQHVQ